MALVLPVVVVGAKKAIGTGRVAGNGTVRRQGVAAGRGPGARLVLQHRYKQSMSG